ncbi:MAG: HD domain-containing protein [Bacteroidales bacterium]|nr:HD domain-containing protein [Bacteroidales bacterium]
MNFESVKKYILQRLERELDPRLIYHSLHHTLDVLESADRIAEMENITASDKILLQTACLFHDSGMLITYQSHEDASIRIVKETLPLYGYTENEVEIISQMILSTKLPQNAKLHLDQILCDADLDYLGRNDFFMIAHKLKLEWDVLDVLHTTLTEWYRIQQEFLSGHRYFTPSAISLREEGKLENLRQIELILNHE